MIECFRCHKIAEESNISSIVCEACYEEAKEQGLLFNHSSMMAGIEAFLQVVDQNRVDPIRDSFEGRN